MQDDPTPPAGDPDGQQHPLERAQRFFERAAPVIRDAADALERHGGLDQVRDTVVERASELVHKAEDAIAKATAIEGIVVERDADAVDADAAPAAGPTTAGHVRARRARLHYLELALLAFAATFGALMLQRRLRR